MKLLNWLEFAEMPAGTFAHRYTPCMVGEPFIKGKTIYSSMDKDDPIDYYYANPWPTVIFDDHGNGKPNLEWLATYGCDGCYDYDCHYLVYDEKDMAHLQKVLSNTALIFDENDNELEQELRHIKISDL